MPVPQSVPQSEQTAKQEADSTQPAKGRQVCSVCLHPAVNLIDSLAIEATTPVRRLAEQFGVTSSSLQRHKSKCIPLRLLSVPGVDVAAVRTQVVAAAPEVVRRALEDKVERLRVLQADFDRSEALIQARAAAGGQVAGDETGLLAVTRKAIRTGEKDFQVISEGEFDGTLMTHRRAIMRHITEETGERLVQTGKDRTSEMARGGALVVVVPYGQTFGQNAQPAPGGATDTSGPGEMRHRIDHNQYTRAKRLAGAPDSEPEDLSQVDIDLDPEG
jgi:hypothetical protein